MLKVYDDIVPQGLQNYIEEMMTDSYFPWFINPKTAAVEYDSALYKDSFQFVHTVFDEGQKRSQAYHEMLNLFHAIAVGTGIKFKEIYRIKANLQTMSTMGEKFCYPPHVDQDRAHLVVIYYVNDSDGDLHIFDKIDKGYTIKQTISPRKGRVVLFDGDLYHAGRPPITSDMRIAVNFNFV